MGKIAQPELTDEEVYANLRSNTCLACGGRKRSRQSFCPRDYYRLPPETRNALYEQLDYPETFRAALRTL